MCLKDAALLTALHYTASCNVNIDHSFVICVFVEQKKEVFVVNLVGDFMLHNKILVCFSRGNQRYRISSDQDVHEASQH